MVSKRFVSPIMAISVSSDPLREWYRKPRSAANGISKDFSRAVLERFSNLCSDVAAMAEVVEALFGREFVEHLSQE